MTGPKVVGVNTLHYHLQHDVEAALALLERATHMFMNEQAYRFIAEQCGDDLFAYLPRVEVVFRNMGREGVRVITNDTTNHFAPPTIARPLAPTNAGDAFAGTVMGYLACDEAGAFSLDCIVREGQQESLRIMQNSSFYRKEYRL